MRRDRRLLFAMVLFSISLIAGAIQAWIVQAYIYHAIMGSWEQFAEFFGVEAPTSGPNAFCFDYCAPKLPFAAGWIAITAFVIGWITLAYAWWKPRS
ncbi:hypothetical protein GRI58_12370 [Porphyrobacter algicida]|uniref:Disulfide bond formation protein B n=1 Tax=Qipengyuania algicida TaxID=1836209 RepID=A0A845AL56_9SPHN|nr:hypothetical protein [Qipengyuania algicida]MXP29611.1 hypothetical protein [Qipengyuania algicida]